MNNQSEWKVVAKNKKNKKNKKRTSNNIFSKNNMYYNEKIDIQNPIDYLNKVENNANSDMGDKLMLPNKYVLWCHDILNKDWSIKGYIKLCCISTISDFWRLINNLDKIGYRSNNFFLMKEDTEPIWEHINNRNGGICSFRTDIDLALNVYEDLCINMVRGELIDNMEDINGISISPKNNWAIIKIWNKDKNNDLSSLLKNNLAKKYNNYSIKYKANEPEF